MKIIGQIFFLFLWCSSQINVPLYAAVSVQEETKPVETTPLTINGSEAFVFDVCGGVELRLHVVKPAGWDKQQRRVCLVNYFGGGWNSGTPERSIAWAQWAAQQGMVGIAPDYRTRNRFNCNPEDCIADARAAMRWIIKHADELGVDPSKIISSGGSAGGHVAAWTAIAQNGPGHNDAPPSVQPVALILLNPVTDTKAGGYGGPKRFGGNEQRALGCSVTDQMTAKMPPTIVFHATGDVTVPYINSVAFKDKMLANGNRCELITFQGLGHSYNSSKLYGDQGTRADQLTKQEAQRFLRSLNLLPTEALDETRKPILSESSVR